MKRNLLFLAALLSCTFVFAQAPQTLPFSQNWTNNALITVDDNWSGVLGIQGRRGDNITGGTGVDPQTLLAADDPGVIDVIANQANPNTNATGGVAEFDGIADDVVALQGSGTADAPYLLIAINTLCQSSVVVQYNVRDIDGSTDNAIQQVALQYRIGSTGAFTNLPAGFVADATTGPSLAVLVTAVNVTLPAACDNQAVVQLRIMTANAVGNDEWVGIDDINITATPTAISGVLSVVDDVICVSGTGSFEINISGGTGPYTAVYNDGSMNITLNSYASGTDVNVAAGTYTLVSVTDANGCTASVSGSATIILSDGPTNISSVDTQPSCSNDDGAIDLTASGDFQPLTFSWTTMDGSGLNPSDEDQTGLSEGLYSVVITDDVGCTALYETILAIVGTCCELTDAGLSNVHCENNNESTDPDDDFIWFQLNPTGTDLGTNGYNVTVSSGSVLWNGSTAPDNVPYGNSEFFRLQAGSAGAGNVTVFIADADDPDCVISVEIIDPGSCSPPACDLEITDVAVTDETCPGDNDGSITITATCSNCNGALEYSIDGINWQPENFFTGLAPNTYTVYVREVDNPDCTVSSDVTVEPGDNIAPFFNESPLPQDATYECSDVIPDAETLTASDLVDLDVPVIFNEETTPGSCPQEYTITRTWTATDDCNNSTEHVQIITVEDNTPPTLENLPDVSVSIECDQPLPDVPDVTATDLCDPDVIVIFEESEPSFNDCPQEYSFTRTWTATDACGNGTTFVQSITVTDNTAPVFNQDPLPQDYSIDCSEAIPMPEVLDGTDNCDPGQSPPVIFVNEIHYDNAGTDAGEFIEIAGTAGINLSGYQIVLYNGATGIQYNTLILSGVIPNEGGGFGAVSFPYAVNGLQNGSPDGFAFGTTSGMVLQFLSYEGTFTAVGSIADGMLSTDIGVVEDGTNAIGTSLQLTGAGMQYGDFTWVGPLTASPGTLNAGQSLTALPGVIMAIFSQTMEPGACNGEGFLYRNWMLTDACGNSVMHTQTITLTDGNGPDFIPPLPQDLTLSCEDDVPPPVDLLAVDACDMGTMMTNVWINEIHYDNTGGDVGEFVEIAGTAGVDMSEYSIVLYNGNGGAVYDTDVLTGLMPNLSNGFGTVCFTYPANGVQNGAPDGIALVHNVMGGMVVQFLSYEGSFMAVGGPANGMTSTDIGVLELGTEPVGQSLRLSGTGVEYADFVWNAPAVATNCGVNTGQTFLEVSVGPDVTFTETSEPGDCPQESTITRTWEASDDCGNVSTHTQVIMIVDDTAPEFEPAGPADLTLNCEEAVPDAPILGATDNCAAEPFVTYEETIEEGDCAYERTITRTWTAEDDCQNQNTHIQIISIVDNEPPVLTCPADLTINLDIFGNATLDASDIDFTATDNCSSNDEVMVVASSLTFDCDDAGMTIAYTIEATDACGNVGSCTIQVFVAPFERCTPVILISDPCVCKNNATTLFNGQFAETIKIESLAGKTWTVIANTGFYRANSPTPPAAPVLIALGTTFTENPIPSGDYFLSGVHVDALGYSITVRSESGEILTIGNSCLYPNPTITSDLSGAFCLFSNIVDLTGTPGDDNIISEGFTVNGVPATQFDPGQGIGTYVIVYTVDGGVPKDFGPNDPGCIQSVQQIVHVIATPSVLGCNDLITVSLPADCEGEIRPDDVLEGTYGCFDDYIVELDRTLPLGNGPWTSGIITADDIGKTYQTRVTHLVSGNKCWGSVKIEDKVPPTLTCEDFSVPCNTPNLTPGYLLITLEISAAFPQVFDCQNFTLTYIDSEAAQNCASGLTKIVTRKWTATDASGNSSTCLQLISLLRPTLDNVVVPPDYDAIDAPAFECTDNAYPTPEWIESLGLQGFPYLFGFPSGCSINWGYEDVVIEVCDGTYKIRREWTIIDWCIGDGFIYNQIIKVLDEDGPTMTCPADMTVSVDPFSCCAFVNLPDVLISDNCSSINSVSGMVVTFDPFTGEQTGMHTFGGNIVTGYPGDNAWDLEVLGAYGWTPCLPQGTHTVTYIAEDDCGNTTTCSFRLTIRDYVPPVAACDETTTIAIGVDDPFDCYGPVGPNGIPAALDACQFAGVTWVRATTFDDGSYDQCNNVKFTIRRMGPDYSDCIDALNTTNGYLACDDFFPDFPSEFERAISEYDSIKFYCCEVGTIQTIILRVYQVDVNGNFSIGPDGTPVFNECMIQVEVQDKLKPVCVSPANVTVSCEQFDPSLWLYGKASVYDNCCLDETKVYQGQCGLTHAVNYSNFDTLCNKGTIVRTFRAFDCHGQSSQCTQRIVVNYEQDYYVRFPNDVIVTICDGSGVYGEPTFFGEDCELLGVSFTDEVFTVVPDACYKIERLWKVINWCTYNNFLGCVNVPNPNPNAITNHPTNLPGPIVSPVQLVGDPWKSTIVKVNPTDPLATNYSSFYNPNANCYTYKQIIKVIDTHDPVAECPASPVTLCDLTGNDPQLWNAQYWWDNGNQSHDLCEAPSEICLVATDACSGSNINFEYQLFLDLDGDNVMETLVNSTQLGSQVGGLGWNNIWFGNVGGPGQSRQFDGRPVPQNQKWGFALQEIVTGNTKRACVMFNTFQAQNTFVQPQLPHGTHKIKWFVTDGCGNEAICEYTIIIKDCKAPTVVCLHGLSVNIMPTEMIQLWASDFLQYTEDNCTLTPYLKIGIRKCGTGTGFPVDANGNPITNVIFTCDELGPQCVEIWSIDLAGNADFCATELIVQDNNGNCGNTSVNVSGALKTEISEGVSEGIVTVTSGAASVTATSDDAGLFQALNAVPENAAATITPAKDDNPLNGVTTYDLVLISKHILGIEPLGSSYKMIAADANKSNSITTLDIVELRKLILGIYQELPANTSWRFVDKAQVFTNPSNPFMDVIRENISVTTGTADLLNQDFVGVKIGDVNNTALANATAVSDDRSVGTLLFDLNDRDVKAGEEFEVAFTAAEKIQGYQMTLKLNGLAVSEIVGNDKVSEKNFGVFADVLTVSVDGTSPFSGGGEGEASFTVKFRAAKSGKLSEMLKVSSDVTKAEAYSVADGRMEVALRFDGKTIAGVGFELYQNQPNPFVNKTFVGFNLPEATSATLSVYDETGRVVFTQKGDFAKGYNAISLDRALLNTTGVLYYTLETATDAATMKMIQVR